MKWVRTFGMGSICCNVAGNQNLEICGIESQKVSVGLGLAEPGHSKASYRPDGIYIENLWIGYWQSVLHRTTGGLAWKDMVRRGRKLWYSNYVEFVWSWSLTVSFNFPVSWFLRLNKNYIFIAQFHNVGFVPIRICNNRNTMALVNNQHIFNSKFLSGNSSERTLFIISTCTRTGAFSTRVIHTRKVKV